MAESQEAAMGAMLNEAHSLQEHTAEILELPHIIADDTLTSVALTAHNAAYELYQRLGAAAHGVDYTPPPGGPLTLEEWKATRDRGEG